MFSILEADKCYEKKKKESRVWRVRLVEGGVVTSARVVQVLLPEN